MLKNRKSFLLRFAFVFQTLTLIGCRSAKPPELPEILNEVLGEEVVLGPTAQAEQVGFKGMSGIAIVDNSSGQVQITVTLPDGVNLPEGGILEGWLVDWGVGDRLGKSSASDQDEKFGISFADLPLKQNLDNAPYALTLGELKADKGKWVLRSDLDTELTPYDAILVTLESDGHRENYDPRPATPIMTGEIKGEDLEEKSE